MKEELVGEDLTKEEKEVRNMYNGYVRDYNRVEKELERTDLTDEERSSLEEESDAYLNWITSHR